MTEPKSSTRFANACGFRKAVMNTKLQQRCARRRSSCSSLAYHMLMCWRPMSATPKPRAALPLARSAGRLISRTFAAAPSAVRSFSRRALGSICGVDVRAAGSSLAVMAEPSFAVTPSWYLHGGCASRAAHTSSRSSNAASVKRRLLVPINTASVGSHAWRRRLSISHALMLIAKRSRRGFQRRASS